MKGEKASKRDPVCGMLVDANENAIEYKQMHFDPTRAIGQYVPIYVAIGNHEKLAPEFFEYMMFPAQPDDPLSEASYGFRWGDTYFLVVDTTNIFFPAGPMEPPSWK